MRVCVCCIVCHCMCVRVCGCGCGCVCVCVSCIPRTEEIGLKLITTAKISNKFSRESPWISNTFSRDLSEFQLGFHVSKRSPRHSKEWTGKPSNPDILSLISSVSGYVLHCCRVCVVHSVCVCVRVLYSVPLCVCVVEYVLCRLTVCTYVCVLWVCVVHSVCVCVCVLYGVPLCVRVVECVLYRRTVCMYIYVCSIVCVVHSLCVCIAWHYVCVLNSTCYISA